MIGQILIRLGYISEEGLIAALGSQLKIPYLPLQNYSINPEVAHGFDAEFCRQNSVIPFDADSRHIFIAISDPLNETAIQEMEKKSGLKAQVFISTPTEIFNILDLIYSNTANSQMKKAG